MDLLANTEKVKLFRGVGSILKLCVPTWSLKEMLELHSFWNPNNYSEHQIRDRYALYGGSARFVIEMSETEAQSRLTAALKKRLLKRVFASTLLYLPKNSLSGVLLHPFPNPDNPSIFQMRLASDYIAKILFNKLVADQKLDARMFLEMIRSEPEMAAYAGYVLEGTIHGRVLSGIKVSVRNLVTGNTVRDVTLPALELASLFSSMTDFEEVKVDQLKPNLLLQTSVQDISYT